uniref:Uncharacterized protein n=1 Tax=Phytophthora ramorum TaxID=164328 RepID=H3HDU2_PHYRM
MEARAKVRIRGTSGCELLRHVESVDPRAAEGLRREKPVDSPHELDVLLEDETRRSITDSYQRLLFEVKVLHRKGNFKSSQGDLVVQRVRDIASGGKTALDLSGFLIFDEFVDLLVPYLRSKTCKLAVLNLSRTTLAVPAAISVAQATNGVLQTLQFSENPIPVDRIRSQAAEDGCVVLSGQKFNHLDAAAIGVLVERERKKVQKLDLSGNLLTGPKANVFHGITSIFQCLKSCRQLQELNLSDTNLRADGLVAFSNAIEDFPALEKLDLSRNRLTYNSTDEKRVSGVEAFCNTLWRVQTLRELSLVGNSLDYQCSPCIAEMLKVNTTLEVLTLAQNPLGDAGIVDLSTALKKNAVLVSLSLSDCQLSCEGMNELSTVLRKFNSTLRTLIITDNPEVRSQGYRNLAKCLSVNHKITEDPQRFRGFPALSETQRTNFVDKLERFSESELRQLHEERIVEKAALFTNEKEAAGLSTLRHYAAMEQYAPLKRMLWCFEVGTRHKDLMERETTSKTRGLFLKRPHLLQSVAMAPPDLKAGPVTRVCHVCGRQYGMSSFEIHLKQCKKMWVQQEEQKPKKERRPIPKTPPGLGEALNQAAQETFNVHGMETCEFCGRTFAEGRLAIHNKSCTADSVSKKVADGAVPRNKKEPAVDYGRARQSTRPRVDSSSSEADGAGESTGGSSPPKPTTAGGSASKQRIQSPLEQSVDAASLAEELQGKESMISVIQAKLDRWEATTVATLQEIRDLKEVFAQLNAS